MVPQKVVFTGVGFMKESDYFAALTHAEADVMRSTLVGSAVVCVSQAFVGPDCSLDAEWIAHYIERSGSMILVAAFSKRNEEAESKAEALLRAVATSPGCSSVLCLTYQYEDREGIPIPFDRFACRIYPDAAIQQERIPLCVS